MSPVAPVIFTVCDTYICTTLGPDMGILGNIYSRKLKPSPTSSSLDELALLSINPATQPSRRVSLSASAYEISILKQSRQTQYKLSTQADMQKVGNLGT